MLDICIYVFIMYYFSIVTAMDVSGLALECIYYLQEVINIFIIINPICKQQHTSLGHVIINES